MDNLRFSKIGVSALALMVTLSGCSQTKHWLGERGMPGFAEPEVQTVVVSMDTIIAELSALVTVDAETQARIHDDAKAVAAADPLPIAKLRYALVLATPGHAASNPVAARDLLAEILSEPDTLTNTEADLARIYLAHLKNLIEIQSEINALRESKIEEKAKADDELVQQLAAAEARNKKLKKSLKKAEKKLEAITSIERSMRERTDKEQ